MLAKVVYPGSFDPITLGHLDIIRRILKIFGSVSILLAHSPKKQYFFSIEERLDLVKQSVKGIKGVRVDVCDGLTVDYMRAHKVSVIVRGIRAVTDFENEMVMAHMNKKLSAEVETLTVFASPEFYSISSSLVKEVAYHGGLVKGLVPVPVEKALKRKFSQINQNLKKG